MYCSRLFVSLHAKTLHDVRKLTERGTAVLDDDGKVIFTPSSTGNIRFQVPGDAAWCSAMLEKIRSVNKTH